MDKYNAYKNLVEIIYEGTRVINKYQSQPRNYGTDITLYMAEVHILAMIFEQEGVTVSELAENTNKSRSAITQTVNKLEKKDLVRKERNPEYHKKINLFTTDIGRETCLFHNDLDHTNYEKTLKSLEDFSIEEFERLGKLYRVISDHIKLEIE